MHGLAVYKGCEHKTRQYVVCGQGKAVGCIVGKAKG